MDNNISIFAYASPKRQAYQGISPSLYDQQEQSGSANAMIRPHPIHFLPCLPSPIKQPAMNGTPRGSQTSSRCLMDDPEKTQPETMIPSYIICTAHRSEYRPCKNATHVHVHFRTRFSLRFFRACVFRVSSSRNSAGSSNSSSARSGRGWPHANTLRPLRRFLLSAASRW